MFTHLTIRTEVTGVNFPVTTRKYTWQAEPDVEIEITRQSSARWQGDLFSGAVYDSSAPGENGDPYCFAATSGKVRTKGEAIAFIRGCFDQ